MAPAGTLARSSRAFIRSADRSSARTSRKMPFSAWARPIGVRTASMTTACRIWDSLLCWFTPNRQVKDLSSCVTLRYVEIA